MGLGKAIITFINRNKLLLILLLLSALILILIPAIPIVVMFAWTFIHAVGKVRNLYKCIPTTDGPNLISWFDSICFINSINHLMAASPEFIDDIKKIIKHAKKGKYKNMMIKYLDLIEYINKKNNIGEHTNNNFIESFKEVCDDTKTEFWNYARIRKITNRTFDYDISKKYLGNCASGLYGVPMVYLIYLINSNIILSRKYKIIGISRSADTLENLIHKNLKTKLSDYYIVSLAKDDIHAIHVTEEDTRITGIKDTNDYKGDFTINPYVILRGVRYNIIAYSHIYGHPIHHALTIRKYKGKWYKMISTKDKKGKKCEVDINILKNTIHYGNTIYLLQKS